MRLTARIEPIRISQRARECAAQGLLNASRKGFARLTAHEGPLGDQARAQRHDVHKLLTPRRGSDDLGQRKFQDLFIGALMIDRHPRGWQAEGAVDVEVIETID
ncbi:MAG: hypothetical protein M5U27_10165 [Gaiella sp.]|nr:hypothetical protein [Gaiella sp.]